MAQLVLASSPYSYVLSFAPFVHLSSAEAYYPTDIVDHLAHTTPRLNSSPIPSWSDEEHCTLDSLDELNAIDNGGNGFSVFLTSDDDVESRPAWLTGVDYGVPDPRRAGRSDAPAVLVVADKGDGIVDAFWFFFYSFNQGNSVLHVPFGNHVGDWEHCLVRFHNGTPAELFLSAHSGGEAYRYDAMEKIGTRPLIYSAVGTHAMYPTSGTHPYVLPWGLLHDDTDRGPLWDPSLNVYSYLYDVDADSFSAVLAAPPPQWLAFNGRWGDQTYPLGDRRQYQFAGQYHYVDGPLGPQFKHLARRHVCQAADDEPCHVRDDIHSSSPRTTFDLDT